MSDRRPTGMGAFRIVSFGQFISYWGTGMTQFAITIWVWQITGQATALALVGAATWAPEVLLGLMAGVLVDRWSSQRKLVMMLSDLAAGLSTVTLLLLHLTGSLAIWHLVVLGILVGTFKSFQWPAYSAAISTMITKEQYARAGGITSLVEYGSGVLAPVAAGALIGLLGWEMGFNGIRLILLIDIVTFVIAIGLLLWVRIPQTPPAGPDQLIQRRQPWQEMTYGFRYILARPGLFGIQMVFFGGNLMNSLGLVLIAPMILARTDNNTWIMGSVQSLAAIGGVLGGIAMSVWGGPKQKIHGVLFGWVITGLGQMVLGFGLPFWFLGYFLAELMTPVLYSCNQAIWQTKVPINVQGRVFAGRRFIAQLTVPLGVLLSGPLADRVFEPAMMPNGLFATLFGWLIGTGPGAGMALLITVSGFLIVLIGLASFGIPAIRGIEHVMPDYEGLSPSAASD